MSNVSSPQGQGKLNDVEKRARNGESFQTDENDKENSCKKKKINAMLFFDETITILFLLFIFDALLSPPSLRHSRYLICHIISLQIHVSMSLIALS